ncbi:hypothetical protein M153_5410001535 [Pseudoloma neurophilia]|uniref:Uncharacterized protein n=1 Tax=Pseudoloma neurophilia TaxID=146866 RepID=A0A0R0LWX9_9MICR|nr:hypothetical protein M153_5410001535 [Pseudoloma neurophilia]
MNERYHMASTATGGDQVAPDGQKTIKQIMEEAEYLCFETKILDVERELTFCDGFRKSSKDLKLKIMEILKEKKSHPKMFAEIIEYLTIEYERIRKKNIDKEKKDLEERLEELQREYRYTRMIRSGFDLQGGSVLVIIAEM